MPARKTKKTAPKKVTRARKSPSGLGPVHFIMIGITAAVLLAGYLFYQQNIESPTSPKNELKETLVVEKSKLDENEMVDAEDGTQKSEESDSITLVSINASKQSGTVMITDVDEKAVVSVTLLGSSEQKQSAYIHYGSCEYPGEVKYPLVDLVDGSSKTTLEISKEELLWGLPLSVIAHTSTTDNTAVACGDLTY